MKFYKASFLALSISASVLGVDATQCVDRRLSSGETAMERCPGQESCMKFTMEKVAPTACMEEDCEYKICYELDFSSQDCPMEAMYKHSIEYSCQKPDNQCLDNGGFELAVKQIYKTEGHKECQIVKPGGKAEFLINDGCGCKDSIPVSKPISGSTVANCGPRPESTTSCTDLSSPTCEPCLWTIEAPACVTEGGCDGDPHCKRWNGNRFSYHGECDLVMVQSEEFGDRAGLDIHIRTTIKKFYSFIEAIALRIGTSVLEVSGSGMWFNNVQISPSQLPANIEGYPIVFLGSPNAADIYKIELNQGDYIEIHIYKMFLSIKIFALGSDFANSVGLLGSFPSGDKFARDGTTIITLDDEFGAEWQVRPDEQKLFHHNRSPQLPEETCRMPSVSGARGLRGLYNNTSHWTQVAKEACSHKSPMDFDFCVFDVMATRDVGMAGAW